MLPLQLQRGAARRAAVRAGLAALPLGPAGARARELFLRAGQFDAGRGGLRRIRAAAGAFPRALPLHLIYNATPDLLAQLERLDEASLARLAADTLRADTERATRDGAHVVGLQLDLDVPTRLLPRYARVLRLLRPQLTPSTR